MDCNIVLNALRESIDYIKKLDEIRGELDENTLEPKNAFENVDFERDYQDADMFLNNKYLSLRIFEKGFDEFMSSEIPAKYEKIYLLSQILIISKTCDNLIWSGSKEYEIYTYDYFDEKSGFDEDWRDIDGERVWCMPDLDSFKTLFSGERELNIFFNYSYYIISIAKIISDAVNKHLFKNSNLKRNPYSKKGYLTNIDVEGLKEFFVRDFKVKEENKPCFDTLIRDLEVGTFNKKEITAIASIIYYGTKIHPAQKDTLLFTNWLRSFYNLIGIKPPTNKECQVKEEIKALSKTFYYLQVK